MRRYDKTIIEKGKAFEENHKKAAVFHPDYIAADIAAKEAKKRYENYLGSSYFKRTKEARKMYRDPFNLDRKRYDFGDGGWYLKGYVITVIFFIIIIIWQVDKSFLSMLLAIPFAIILAFLGAFITGWIMYSCYFQKLRRKKIKEYDEEQLLRLRYLASRTEAELHMYTGTWEQASVLVFKNRQQVIDEAKKHYQELVQKFGKFLAKEDWDKIDFLVYYIKTGKVDTLEEAIILAKEQKKLPNFQDNIKSIQVALRENKNSAELVKEMECILSL